MYYLFYIISKTIFLQNHLKMGDSNEEYVNSAIIIFRRTKAIKMEVDEIKGMTKVRFEDYYV